jgi:hypothetical protein
MRDAIDQYYADKGKYPDSLQTLVSESYIRSMPRDPFTTSSDTWQTVPAEPESGASTAAAGIFDVKSGSEGTGTRRQPPCRLVNGAKTAESGFLMVALLIAWPWRPCTCPPRCRRGASRRSGRKKRN